MDNLISVENPIEEAKKTGIDFGKGDPYNRLRYYTKMGWLPHMIRKVDGNGNLKGHYPLWALDQLVLIENLKAEGFTNDAIAKRVQMKTKLQSIKETIRSKEIQNRALLYAILVSVLLILANELEILKLSKPKSALIKSIDTTKININEVKLFDSGNAYVPKGQNTVFIKNIGVRSNSKIYITFNQNYSPATRYWVSKVEDMNGFSIELDAPVSTNVEFNWWVSN